MQVDLSYNTEDLTFISTCNNAYHNFADPFIHFCKVSNPGCKVEIWASEPKQLSHISDPDVKIHQLPTDCHVATYRYIAEPTFKTKYTYITDIDIMHTEQVLPFHIQHMQERGICFSNIQRTKKGEIKRLSGLHFVETEPWYNLTKDIRAHVDPKGQDEMMLYEIAEKIVNMTRVSKGLAKRPIHGIHCSVGRNVRSPYSSKGWELTSQKIAVFVDEINKVGMFNTWFEQMVVKKLMNEKLCNKIKKRIPNVR